MGELCHKYSEYFYYDLTKDYMIFLTTLKVYRLAINCRPRNCDISSFFKNLTVCDFSISGYPFNNLDIKNLAENKNITFLSISCRKRLPDECFKYFSKNTTLRKLNLYHNNSVSLNTLKKISQNASLKKLSISVDNSISKKDIIKCFEKSIIRDIYIIESCVKNHFG